MLMLQSVNKIQQVSVCNFSLPALSNMLAFEACVSNKHKLHFEVIQSCRSCNSSFSPASDLSFFFLPSAHASLLALLHNQQSTNPSAQQTLCCLSQRLHRGCLMNGNHLCHAQTKYRREKLIKNLEKERERENTPCTISSFSLFRQPSGCVTVSGTIGNREKMWF